MMTTYRSIKTHKPFNEIKKGFEQRRTEDARKTKKEEGVLAAKVGGKVIRPLQIMNAQLSTARQHYK